MPYELAFSLGNLCNTSDEFIVKLDSDARAERAINGRNIVSIGGPGAECVTGRGRGGAVGSSTRPRCSGRRSGSPGGWPSTPRPGSPR